MIATISYTVNRSRCPSCRCKLITRESVRKLPGSALSTCRAGVKECKCYVLTAWHQTLALRCTYAIRICELQPATGAPPNHMVAASHGYNLSSIYLIVWTTSIWKTWEKQCGEVSNQVRILDKQKGVWKKRKSDHTHSFGSEHKQVAH